MRLVLVAGALTLLVACPEASDISDTGDIFAGAPDVTGGYQVTLTEVEGCADTPAAPEAWGSGELTVSGEPASLSFDFGDGAVFAGTVEASYFWQLGDVGTLDGYALQVFADGVVGQESSGWVFEGFLQVEAEPETEPSARCSATARITANQVNE